MPKEHAANTIHGAFSIIIVIDNLELLNYFSQNLLSLAMIPHMIRVFKKINAATKKKKHNSSNNYV